MKPPFEESQAHRWFAVELNNRAWDLIESTGRSDDDDDLLIHTAHAAYLHWQQVGTALHRLRALCLLANAYLAVGQGEVAATYARRCLELSEQKDVEATAFDRATACECHARANAATGNTDVAREFRRRALEAAGQLEDPEDRKVFDDMMARGEWYGAD